MTDAADTTRLPDFIGLGAQKAGSSWVYMCLNDHPDITIPEKDPMFFSDETRFVDELGDYLAAYARAPQTTRVGEFSTTYLQTPGTAKRIYATAPDARLIVSLRNPIDRAFSNFKNDVIHGYVSSSMTFEEALRTRTKYVERGRYYEQLVPYLDLFPREQIGIFFFDDIATDPQSLITAMYRFVGVREHYTPSNLEDQVNAGRSPRSRFVDTVILGGGRMINRLMPDSVSWRIRRLNLHERLFNLNAKQDDRIAGVDAGTRSRLSAEFDDDVTKLEGLTGRDLSAWRA